MQEICLKDKGRMRQGDKSVWLDYEQIRSLEYDKGEYFFESEVLLDTSIEDVDREALDLYRRALGASVDDEKLLRSLGVLKDGHLTNAGMMLFGENAGFVLPQSRFRVLKIDGTEMGAGSNLRIIKDRTFEGPLVKAIPEARDFIASQLREYQFQVPGVMEFKTVPEYPEYPWFEGLVNAVTHRDYSIYGEYIRVYIFDDRMLIQSPGKLPNTVTLKNIRHRRFSRNPIIARVFTAFDWVRELNEGVDKIFQEMGSAGLPEPEYVNQDDYYLKLTLRNNLKDRIPRLRNELAHGMLERIPEGQAADPPLSRKVALDALDALGLTDRELRVLGIVESRGRISPSDLVEELGVSRRTASDTLKRLTAKGILEWHGSSSKDPSQFYTAKNVSQ